MDHFKLRVENAGKNQTSAAYAEQRRQQRDNHRRSQIRTNHISRRHRFIDCPDAEIDPLLDIIQTRIFFGDGNRLSICIACDDLRAGR